MAFRFLPREDEYFVLFSQMTARMQEASTALVELTQGNSANFESIAKKIKDAEHACDAIAHEITTKLNKSFITPFDREDIYALTGALDDVMDYIDAGTRAILMYNIKEITEHAKHLAKVIQGLTIEINSAVSMLSKPTNLNQHIVEIHRLENEADDVYFRAIGELFHKTTDPIELIKWKELYEILENGTDRCESVANIIESIMLKHT
jgi:predicted phosphate transport protein (TIGR00153 family)